MRIFKLSILILTAFSFQIIEAQESNLKNIKKLTFGGDNAEAYFSPNGKMLTLQVTNPDKGIPCDQIYSLDITQQNIDFNSLKLISTGKGRTTCSYFMPDGKHIIYASTHQANEACPAPQNQKMENIYGLFILNLKFISQI
jgi:Tol biopolymer transport system component